MNVRFGYVFPVAAALIAAGCSEPAQSPTEAPAVSLGKSIGTSCSFNSMNSSISKFFSNSTQQQAVKDLQGYMSDEWSAGDTSMTRDYGYDIFREIATAVTNGAVSNVSSGSDLTNQVSACMFFDSDQLPADFPHDYTTELTPSTQGAFAVRGGPSDDGDPVLARGTSPVSGIAPQSSSTTTTWSASLSGVVPPARVLFYGQPASDPYSYEWKAIPANAQFDPALVVGLCDPGDTYLVYESGGSILPYASAYFLTGACPTSTASLGVWQQPFAFAKRMASRLLPSRLEAEATGLGGLGKGFSIFTTYNVQTVTPTFLTQPHDATVLPSDVCPDTPIGDPYNIGPVTMRVTKNGISVGGVSVSVTQVNNNGTPATLCGNTTGVTDADGYVTVDGLGLTKTGGYVLVLTGSVEGRNINSTTATSDRFNIKP